MNSEDVLRLAKESELDHIVPLDSDFIISELKRFADLVVADEREACADVCEGHYDTAQAARAIRARGEKNE